MEELIYKAVTKNNIELTLKATIYRDNSQKSKGVLLYYPGGGLIFGNRKDLPNLHIEKLNSNGYSIISFDYRLAPEADFDLILEDILDSIEFFLNNREDLGFSTLPYYLWGRSAGAFLILLASTKKITIPPNGLISYYGYGFTEPNWYNTGNIHYLKYHKIDKEKAFSIVGENFISHGNIPKRFPLYIYGRQNGNWISIISKYNDEEFLKKYSLLNKPEEYVFPPTFLAHSFKDNDVPYSESINLSKIIKDSCLFTCSADEHDFDRLEKDKNTIDLLNKTIDFLNNHG